MTDNIRLEFIGAEARLTLSNGNAGNALSLPDIRSASAAIMQAAAHAEVRVLRLRAEGAAFCLGRAPESGSRSHESTTAEGLRINLILPILNLYRSLHVLDIVSLAEVQGDAYGLGCALVSACDIAVAASSAKFSLPEMAKDLPPTLALSALGRKVSPKAAASLVLGLATFDALSAMRAGIVGEVVEAAALTTRTDEIVAQLSARNSIALATVKRYLRASQSPDFDACAEMAASMLSGAIPAIRATK
jgi:enoyl-CoA hydratase/carnithine racemase